MTTKVQKLYRLSIIKPDGSITHTVQPKQFTLQQRQAAVGGSIENVGYFKRFEGKRVAFAWANGDEYAKRLPYNAYASRMWAAQYGYATTLVGNIAIETRVTPEEAQATDPQAVVKREVADAR